MILMRKERDYGGQDVSSDDLKTILTTEYKCKYKYIN